MYKQIKYKFEPTGSNEPAENEFLLLSPAIWIIAGYQNVSLFKRFFVIYFDFAIAIMSSRAHLIILARVSVMTFSNECNNTAVLTGEAAIRCGVSEKEDKLGSFTKKALQIQLDR